MFFGVPIFALICSLIHGAIDSQLRKKEFSTEIGDYYPENSLAEPIENKEKSGGLFSFIATFFIFVWKKIKQFFVFCTTKPDRKKSKNDKNEPKGDN